MAWGPIPDQSTDQHSSDLPHAHGRSERPTLDEFGYMASKLLNNGLGVPSVTSTILFALPISAAPLAKSRTHFNPSISKTLSTLNSALQTSSHPPSPRLCAKSPSLNPFRSSPHFPSPSGLSLCHFPTSACGLPVTPVLIILPFSKPAIESVGAWPGGEVVNDPIEFGID
jgi:hypothetical protein